jgi:hypothetical protein
MSGRKVELKAGREPTERLADWDSGKDRRLEEDKNDGRTASVSELSPL